MQIFEEFSKEEKRDIQKRLVYELPLLRARIGITQESVAKYLGESRQCYAKREVGYNEMPWSIVLSLLFLFSYNPATREDLEKMNLFPEKLKKQLNINYRGNLYEEIKTSESSKEDNAQE
jgi:DNA-binding XRE family transcriptional regulator